MGYQYSIMPVRGCDDLIIDRLWKEMEHDNLLDRVFYSGDIRSSREFARFIQNNGILFVIITEHDFVGFFYLTNFRGFAAQMHFCLFSRLQKKIDQVHIDVLDQLGKTTREDGTPLVESVYGITPITNRAAILYLKRAGFKEVVRLPHVCYIKKKDKYVEALLSVYMFNEGAESPRTLEVING